MSGGKQLPSVFKDRHLCPLLLHQPQIPAPLHFRIILQDLKFKKSQSFFYFIFILFIRNITAIVHSTYLDAIYDQQARGETFSHLELVHGYELEGYFENQNKDR